jgi:ethanolamine utilization protein EutN
MQLGIVVGRLWSTIKNPGLLSQRMLVVQPVTPELADTGKQLICLDSVGAGAGELIYWTRGKEASFPFLPEEVPTEATITGIVDKVTVRRAGTLASWLVK